MKAVDISKFEEVHDRHREMFQRVSELDAVGTALVLQDVFNAFFSVVDACNHRVPFSENGVWRLLGIGF